MSHQDDGYASDATSGLAVPEVKPVIIVAKSTMSHKDNGCARGATSGGCAVPDAKPVIVAAKSTMSHKDGGCARGATSGGFAVADGVPASERLFVVEEAGFPAREIDSKLFFTVQLPLCISRLFPLLNCCRVVCSLRLCFWLLPCCTACMLSVLCFFCFGYIARFFVF